MFRSAINVQLAVSPVLLTVNAVPASVDIFSIQVSYVLTLAPQE